MKKRLLLIITILCAVAQGTWAEIVSTAEGLAKAVQINANNIELAGDIALPAPLTISVQVTIDMNSHKLTHQTMAGNDNDYNCIFVVTAGGELYLKNGIITDVDNTTQRSTEYIAGAICNKGIADLDNVTIRNCRGLLGGAIRNFSGATLTLSFCTLDGNSARGKSEDGHGNGGVIYNEGTLNLNNTTFKYSKANNEAGVIWNSGNLAIYSCTFTANIATSASVIYHAALDKNGKKPVTISGSTFIDNVSNGSSACGAIRTAQDVTKVTISGNTTFINNTAPSNGGAIYCESVMDLDNVNFTGNSAVKDGGAVFISAKGDVTMENNTSFTDNIAESGGAVYNDGKLTLDGIAVSSNTAKEYGGGILDDGILNVKGAVIVTDNRLSNNQVNNLYVKEDKMVTVAGSLAGSTIGVSMPDWDVFTSGYSKYNSDVDPATLFKADFGEKFYGVSLFGGEALLSVKPLIHIDNDYDLHVAVGLPFDQINIQLDKDIKTGSVLEIADDRTVTIDMNDRTLNRGLKGRTVNGQVITVRPGSTLNLSEGILTGGFAYDGGAIHNEGTTNLTDVTITGNVADERGGGISNSGTLVMAGGTISGNITYDNSTLAGGGAIFNYEDCTVTLNNVTITGNRAMIAVGGGINSYGTLTLDSCTITGNTAKDNGGGIWSARRSTLNMQGKVTVTDNLGNDQVNNLYLMDGVLITVTGSLADSQIGISMATPDIFTSGYSTYNKGVTPTNLFFSDSGDYWVELRDNEVKLVSEAESSIKEIAHGQLAIDNSWYDLSGRKLSSKPSCAGVYLCNGKQIVIK